MLELITFVTGWEASVAEKRNRQRLAAHARRLRRQDTRGRRLRSALTGPPGRCGRLMTGGFSFGQFNWQAPQSLRCEPTYPPFSERRYLPAVLS